MNFDMVLKQFMLNILILFLSQISELREIIAVLLTAFKKFNVGMHLNVYESVWFKFYTMTDTITLYILNSSLFDLDLDSRSQECKKAKASVAIISHNFQSVRMEFGILLRLVSVMNFILILFLPFNIQGKKPCWP